MILQVLLILLPFASGYETVYGTKRYVEYQRGTSNIVLTSGHGGPLKPEILPDREGGCYNSESGTCKFDYSCEEPNQSKCRVANKNDMNTRELTVELADKLQEVMSLRPHVILSNLHRSKLDPNREIEEAAFGNAIAEKAYNEFHNFIENATFEVNGPGILFDMHGQSHPEKWIELGYTTSIVGLNEKDYNCSHVSIKSLVLRNCDKSCPWDCLYNIVQGNGSFGSYLHEIGGYKVVPSTKHPSPGKGRYYNGGYITRKYGSRYQGQIDSIQIESPYLLRQDSERKKYAKDLANTIKKYVDKYYKTNEEPPASKSCELHAGYRNVYMVVIISMLIYKV